MAVVEITAFHTSADDDTVLSADRRVQTEFFYRQPGLVRRTTARAAGGDWLVVVLWRSDDDATASAARAAGDPAATAFTALADPSSLRSKRYETLD